MNRKDEQKERSHRAILASASALLRGRGIRGSSVADVMKGAGLTVGGFYGHFDSKESLFVEAIRAGAGARWTALLRSAQGATPIRRVLSVVDRYLTTLHRDHPEAGCLMPSAAPEVAREGEPYRTALATALDDVVRSLATAMGDAPGDRERALGTVALMVGALSLSRAVKGTPLSDELLAAARQYAERALDDR